MDTSTIVIIVIVGLIFILVCYVISVYNKLVNSRNKVDNQFSQIDIQLKRRADLIPNLVETVKGYAKHEEGTLTAVIKLEIWLLMLVLLMKRLMQIIN